MKNYEPPSPQENIRYDTSDPPSMKATPNSTPPSDALHISQPATLPTDGPTFHSPESIQFPINLHEVANLNNVLPLQQSILRQNRQVPLNRAVNLEYELPLTSTPRPKRLLQRRRSLPLELVPRRQGLLPSFLHKFKPFRKQHP